MSSEYELINLMVEKPGKRDLNRVANINNTGTGANRRRVLPSVTQQEEDVISGISRQKHRRGIQCGGDITQTQTEGNFTESVACTLQKITVTKHKDQF